MSDIPQTTSEYRIPKAEGYNNLTLTKGPIPALRASEVLVKVHAVSLQYRDLLVAKNEYPLGHVENLIPCSDMAGEIVAVGQDVKGWAVGERVCSVFAVDHIFGNLTDEIRASGLGALVQGVLTQYKVLPAHALVRIPEHLSYEEASTLPCAAVTAYNALLGGNSLRGGDTVLVQGTGGVSIFALQFAVALGATVIATSSSDQKLEVAKRLGATHLINYKKTPDWDKEAMRVTNGRGVDHVVEVGGSGTLMKSVNSLAYGGSIHLIGFVAEQGDVSLVPLYLLGKTGNMRGIMIGSRTQFEDMNRLISAVKLKPIIDKVFSFEDAQKAYAHLESQQHIGKVVIKVSSD